MVFFVAVGNIRYCRSIAYCRIAGSKVSLRPVIVGQPWPLHTMIDLASTLKYSAGVRTRLATPDSTIDWPNVSQAFQLFDVLRNGQTAIANSANGLLAQLQASDDQVDEETLGCLLEVSGGEDTEQRRHFQLALAWRRHVSIQYFRGPELIDASCRRS